MTGKVLWKPPKNYIAFFTFLLFSIYVLLIPGILSNPLTALLAVFFAVLFGYLAVFSLFGLKFAITQDGIEFGDFFPEKPGHLELATVGFNSLFKKPIFLSWSDIAGIQIEESGYRVPLRYSYFVKQKFLVVATTAGAVFWVPFYPETDQYKKESIDLDLLISSKGKNVIIKPNPRQKNPFWTIALIAIIFGILIYSTIIFPAQLKKDYEDKFSSLDCTLACSERGNYKDVNQTCFKECLSGKGIAN